MKFDELIVLLPCHSLEDFPVHYEADEAEAILSAWSTLWHPELIASAGAMPTWYRVDCPPETLAGRLVVVPEMCDRDLPAGYLSRAQEEGAVVVRKLRHRPEMVAAALASLRGEVIPPQDSQRDELVADFLALGFLYLQVELLTRRMRYMSNIDQGHFGQQVVSGAQALVAGDFEETKRRLQNCFDVLAEAREHFYPVDAYLIDVTLVAATTLGAALREELSGTAAVNVLLCGADLQAMADKEPQSVAALRAAWEAKHAGLIGGDYGAADLTLAHPEAILADFDRGLALFQEHLGGLPAIWGRRTYSLAPWLPQLLSKKGFVGAWHVALDEGRVPQTDQAKTRWEGLDGTAIDALARIPLDAAKADSFLGLSVKLGESMDRDHVACVVLAHWPGQRARWYDDLRRASRYAPVLGKFVTIESFFGDTASPGQFTRFEADEYLSPRLKQAIIRNEPDAISRSVRVERAAIRAGMTSALETATTLVRGQVASESAGVTEAAADRINDELVAAAAACIPRAASGTPGVLVFNPCGFSRQIGVDLPGEMSPPAVIGPVLFAGVDGGRPRAVVEVPSVGFAWIGPPASPVATVPASRRAKAPPPMASAEGLMQNGAIEVQINRTTGAIQAVRPAGGRKNLLSQQVALRTPGPAAAPGETWRDPNDTAVYSVMAADAFEIVSAGPVLGEIAVRGRIMDRNGRRLAGFRQTVKLWRGSNVAEIDLELDIEELPRADPWNSYYACRFAWADETADLWRSAGGTRQPTELGRIEAPHYIDLELAQGRATILTGGMPYHRVSGARMLDTLLVVRGETARRFRMGIGVGLKQPMNAAIELLAPSAVLAKPTLAPAVGPSSWLFHVDAKNVVTTHWEPLVEDGKPIGFRVRLLETLSRPTKVRVSAFRPIAAARLLDFSGGELLRANVEDAAAVVEMTGGEWAFLEARW